MSWSNQEYSIAAGQPVMLYQFSLGQKFWRYTSADMDLTVMGQHWEATAIKDGGFMQGTGDNVEITLASSNPVVQLFRGIPPSSPVQLRVYRLHNTDPAQECRTVWVGSVSEVRRESPEQVKLLSTGVASSFTRSGLRLTWGRGCPYSLYDHNCRVSAEQMAVHNLPVTAVTGSGITVTLPAGTAQGYFSGGYIEWSDDGFLQRRGIRTHNDSDLQLFGGSQGLSAGKVITAYPGCDLTLETCSKKFSNHLNYGGCPHMPGVSPWEIIKVF
ncbi:phage BR0599 family protein [Salmonella enterica]|nr:phage BR0599 family protein [Salmonella enterica]EJF5856691.1 phage BR0599 family protein [Salmonella enterica]EJF5948056.1 phage BR0599 family protein [Salmonella enterica]EJF6158041.1 phage BR0599 family protein [Salmonella enterica]EJF6377321.1 phage BR0599 family protein [Salmonella enterica]